MKRREAVLCDPAMGWHRVVICNLSLKPSSFGEAQAANRQVVAAFFRCAALSELRGLHVRGLLALLPTPLCIALPETISLLKAKRQRFADKCCRRIVQAHWVQTWRCGRGTACVAPRSLGAATDASYPFMKCSRKEKARAVWALGVAAFLRLNRVHAGAAAALMHSCCSCSQSVFGLQSWYRQLC